MRLSYSSLETFKQCPLKYKFREIDKLKEPKSKEAVFGTLLHSVLHFAHTQQGALFPTLEDALDFFARNWNADVYEDEQEERAAFSQGVSIIQQYYEQNDIAKATVVDLESRFTIDIGPPEDTHVVSGIIDRIDKTKDGYEIIDYKTAKKMPSQDDVDNNLQLSIYLLAFLKRYPKERENLENLKVSLYFLKHGVKLSSERTEEQLKNVEQEFLSVIHEIGKGVFDPVVTPLCDWCGFQKKCPMWRHRFSEERKIDTDDVNAAIAEFIAKKNDIAAEKKTLAALQEKIVAYMDQEGVERVFSDEGSIARSPRKTYTFDQEVVQSVLEPLGQWDDVLKIDGVALNKIMRALPTEKREELAKARSVKSESVSLTIKKPTAEAST